MLKIFRIQSATKNLSRVGRGNLPFSLPVSRLTCCLYELTHPLRSVLITRTSSLLQDAPPRCSASVLSFLWVLHLNFSLSIGTTGSHVLHKGLNQVHATFMPDAAQTVSSVSSGLILVYLKPPVLTSPLVFRHLINGSLAFISDPYLT